MSRILLTDLSIRSINAERHSDFWDTKLPSFGIRVGPRSKTFIVKVGNSRRAIGAYPDMTLQEARKRALTLKSEGTRPYECPTFAQAYEDFKTVHCSQKRPRTQWDYARIIEKHFLPVLAQRGLDTIDHKTMARITDALLETPSERSHAIAVGRTFFKFCVRRRIISINPLDGVQLPKAVSRDRVLSDEELRKLWHACSGRFGDIVKLLILTGQRKSEIAGLKREWLNKDRSVLFPKEFVKNGLEHFLPVGSAAYALMKTLDGKFTPTSKMKKRLDQSLGPDFEPWTLHDLRRTFATNMAKLGVPIHITERILNHVSGTQSAIVLTYQRYDFARETRAAMEFWEIRLAEIVK